MSYLDQIEYPRVSGTARKAPSGSSSGDPKRATGGIHYQTGTQYKASPSPSRRPANGQDVAIVPRPVAAPKSGLIDLRDAPSSMEQAAEGWKR